MWQQVSRIGCRAVAVTVLISGAGGCASQPLWRTDRHVSIVTPQPLQLVSAPMTLSWRTHDLPSSSREFAVFIDRQPIRPGQSLRAIASHDQSCLHTPGCPNAAYLRARNVFLTGATSVSIPYFADVSGIAARDRPSVHQATVILIDASGHRVGEYVYTVQFRVADSNA